MRPDVVVVAPQLFSVSVGKIGRRKFAALEELKSRAQWVTHIGKVPHQPATGRHASVTNPQHRSSFMAAVRANRDRRHDGLSFVVTSGDPYTGLDLDDCRDRQTGEAASWAMEIVNRFRSYTEVTPSGTGLRIWIKGVLPPGGNRKRHIELYDRAKAFTVTGQHLEGTQETIEDRQAELEAFHRELFPTSPAPPIPASAGPCRLTDDDVLRLATKARNGAKVDRLLRGDCDGHPTESEADMALMGALAFYTQDREQLARLWRGSGLNRRKLDHAKYMQHTIEKAIRNLRVMYDPKYRRR